MSVETDLVTPMGDMRKFLREGLAIAITGRRVVVGVMVVAIACAVFGLRLIPPEFTATLIIGPIAPGGLLGRGAPSPAVPETGGESIGDHGVGEMMSSYDRFIYEMTSYPVAEELALVPNFAPRVFETMWDPATSGWKPDDGPAGKARRLINELVGRTPWTPPDARTLARYIQKEVRIQRIGGTPFRRVTYRHADPEFARLLLNLLYATTERRLRSAAIHDNRKMIEEIGRKIGSVTDIDHRRALRDLLIGHERFAMMMDVDLPLTATLIQPAMAEALPDTPDPVVVLAIAAAMGLVVGLGMVFRAAVIAGDGADGDAGDWRR
ncbi:hypothetical protein N825_10090 [Skermanella stibiiresistens SB22]|uniref:Polysaccharide chain length determinant N-terminal domain-containing protein n=1 Tax=Skermanella stibiiresistens SB22 TaxID=1385369 RepID=W9H5B0_9PROT|nr:hypothetical protein [Skermanella stibiiresistens]EWY38948.1 hypothetical protein N825_10090 [Skermanella stibiiresistens SB22]